jgi:hypothetical protein
VARRADPATPFVACPGEGRRLTTDGSDAAPGRSSAQPEAGSNG